MKHPLLTFSVALTSLAIAGTAYACSCIQSTPAEYYTRATTVFSGTVEAVAQPFGSEWITYSIRSDTTWKGRADGMVSIRSHESTATCGIPLEKGKRYLIYANLSADGGLHTSLCSGTALFDDSKTNLDYLATLQPQNSECEPYICADGTHHPSCSEDGHVINYFADPCLGHEGVIGFADVPPSHHQHEAIVFVKSHGIVEGYPDGTFRPQATIARVEFLKMLVEFTYSDDEIGSCYLRDVDLPDDISWMEWYAPYACVAFEHGIVQGYPDGTFRPGGTINYAEAAKIFVKTMGLAESSARGEWYAPYIGALQDTNALPGSYRYPGQLLRRGEMAEILWNLRITTQENGVY